MDKSLITPCPKCQGKRFVVSITASVVGGNISVIQSDRNPGWAESKNKSELEALSCVNCGYTEFFAKEPSKLKPDIS